MWYKYSYLRFLRIGNILFQVTRKPFSCGITRSMPNYWDLSIRHIYVMYRPSNWF